MSATPTRTDEGIPIVKTSIKPFGTTTVFTGAGDDITTGDGARLLFDIADTDISKLVTLGFNTDIHIKDSIIIRESAPFGAYLDAYVSDANDNIVAKILNKVSIFGNGILKISSEDVMLIPSGYKLNVQIFNSSSKVAFKVAGIIQIYRVLS